MYELYVVQHEFLIHVHVSCLVTSNKYVCLIHDCWLCLYLSIPDHHQTVLGHCHKPVRREGERERVRRRGGGGGEREQVRRRGGRGSE